MVIFLTILSLLLIVALVLSIRVNLRFGRMLMNVEDNTEMCLDIIDKRYYNLLHVFDDSPGTIDDDPLVRRFFNEVDGTRNDVLKIANIISKATGANDIGGEIDSPTQDEEEDEGTASETDL